jgi:hypothetical protein
MRKEVKELIEKHINEIENNDFINIIADAASKGFDAVVELRSALKEATIDIAVFDKQFANMLINYNEPSRITKNFIQYACEYLRDD